MDNFNTASILDLWVGENYKSPIHLNRYENTHSFRLEGCKNLFVEIILPEKLSEKLKDLHIIGFRSFVNPLPSNNFIGSVYLMIYLKV